MRIIFSPSHSLPLPPTQTPPPLPPLPLPPQTKASRHRHHRTHNNYHNDNDTTAISSATAHLTPIASRHQQVWDLTSKACLKTITKGLQHWVRALEVDEEAGLIYGVGHNKVCSTHALACTHASVLCI